MGTALSAPTPKGVTFGIASLVFAALTVLLPVLIALLTGRAVEHNEQAHRDGGWGALILVLLGVMGAVAASGLSALIGTVAGGVALLRGERQVWRPVVGLVVNVPVVLFVVYLIVVWFGQR